MTDQTAGAGRQRRFRGRLRYPAAMEFAILFGIGILLSVGVAMIRSRITERMVTATAAEKEVSGIWGSAQTIGGPALVVPYRMRSVDGAQQTSNTTHRAVFLPDTLQIKGVVQPEKRRRGIFEVILYRTQLQIDGSFSAPDFNGMGDDGVEILWDEAVLTLGIPDLRGLDGNPTLRWDGKVAPLRGGSALQSVWKSGLSADVPLESGGGPGGSHRFSIVTRLNGSDNLSFVPAGGLTTVSIESTWPHPKFEGARLPDARQVSSRGFTSRWQMSSLARSYPQRWIDTGSDAMASAIRGSEFGVSLVTPVSHYLQTKRATEYSVLFIALTFTTFFLYELFCPVSLHPVHYLLVGAALCLFFLLLLSISEHVPFGGAYLIASAATVTLICTYAIAVFHRALNVLGLFAVLAGLYAYLYVLLQLEDWALLSGSLGLFAVLAFVMYVTRDLDWGAAHEPQAEQR